MSIISTWIMILIFVLFSSLGLNFGHGSEEPVPPPAIESQADYVQISIFGEDDSFRSIAAYDDWDGHIYVEYEGDVKKVGTFDSSVMEEITAAIEQSGFRELDGRNEYSEDGYASASLYVSYQDGSYLGASFSGSIPEEFYTCYDSLDQYFQQLTADLPVYVPQPMVEGEIDPEVMDEITAIVDASGIENSDAYLIREIPMDENFTYSAGLTGTDGLVSTTSFSAMMMTDPFSMTIAKLDASANASAIAKDFADNVDFYKWVCVLADQALIAQKGDLVLCLISSDYSYGTFADAILANGWTQINTLHR